MADLGLQHGPLFKPGFVLDPAKKVQESLWIKAGIPKILSSQFISLDLIAEADGLPEGFYVAG
jgi:hypothetical protein